MIKKASLEVVSSQSIAKDTVEMVLENDYISQQAVPGQFLHVSVVGHTLRRPISIAAVNKGNQTITILFKIIGLGTQTLANYQVGSFVDVLGPSGNGFPIEQLSTEDTVLLIGGGIGVPPLYYLGTALKERGVNVQSVLGYQSEAYVFYEQAFKQLGDTYVVTNDGSYGYKGFVTDVVDKISPFETYYSCGPAPMLQAVTNTFPHKQGYLSFEERMGCGVGACLACVIETNGDVGYKKICQDGPVFQADEVKI